MIALYCRVSTTEQAEHGYSVKEQEDRLKKYCDAVGLKNPKVYTDAGYSGAKLDRPALQALIRDVKAHKISKVLSYKLDRLSRSEKDTLTLIEDIFLSNDCDFVSITENFDTSTPLGRAMVGILAVFAQLEREQIKERMSMGREARAKQGKYAGSWRHPIGYDYIDGQLIVNDFEKMQIQEIFESYASGLGCKKIADQLNAKGMTHKYGQWTESVVRSLLSRKTYIGYVRFGNEWFKGTHDPIISEDLFNRVQKFKAHKNKEYSEKGF
jgi:site-specific DNA recombinase